VLERTVVVSLVMSVTLCILVREIDRWEIFVERQGGSIIGM
jgi:hypothetical protein